VSISAAALGAPLAVLPGATHLSAFADAAPVLGAVLPRLAKIG